MPSKSVVVIIPAYNEQNSIAKVINAIPKKWVDEIIVCNNNSTDDTAQNALDAGATVVFEGQKGYGFACLKAIDYLKNKTQKPDIVVFLDADFSDFPEQLPSVVRPILEQGMDLVIGSRALGKREENSMTPQQLFGNWLATRLMRWLYGVHFTDLGPFRAISYEALMRIKMRDTTYGWTVEMQLKAAKHKLKFVEVPVDYRQRIGVSKVSGTVRGTVLAGYKILLWIFKYYFEK